ncbi:helix-turn-helix domain-containing protein [Mycetocola zhadangensis]|nr:helix-turn-helix domain-containing protein [Mycetocola zhadangensis]GGF05384.1 hypothetical protein GCM10011313_30670 [Mycetocola zhadangensis]
MDASTEGDRAADRIFTPRRPASADLSGLAGMDMLSWYARTTANPPDFRLRASFVIFENLTVFRLEHSRAEIDRTPAHVAAVRVGGAFYLVRDGAATLTQNGRTIPLGAGASAFASGVTPHQLHIPESAAMILVVVRRGMFRARGLPESELGPRRFPATSFTEAVSSFLRALASDFPVPSSPEGITSQQATLSLLAGLITSSEGQQRTAQPELSIARALTFIAANYSNPDLTTADVATATGISSRHLQRIFASANNSVADELRRIRIRWAAMRLDEGVGARELTELAASTGFGNIARMRRAFLRQTGMSPTQYRDSAQQMKVASEGGVTAIDTDALPATGTTNGPG